MLAPMSLIWMSIYSYWGLYQVGVVFVSSGATAMPSLTLVSVLLIYIQVVWVDTPKWQVNGRQTRTDSF